MSQASPMELSPLLSPEEMAQIKTLFPPSPVRSSSSVPPPRPIMSPERMSTIDQMLMQGASGRSNRLQSIPGLLEQVGPPMPVTPSMTPAEPQAPMMRTVSQPRPKAVFSGSMERSAIANTAFRRVVFTGPKHQIVLMSLTPGEEIGAEVHPDTQQFFKIEEGTGVFRHSDEYGQVQEIPFSAGDIFDVTPGTPHNLIAQTITKLYTIYSPPHHRDGLIDQTKEDAIRRMMGNL